MLYIIGGPPRIGKTTIAKALSATTSIPYLATDDIQKVIRAYIPLDQHAEKLPLHFMEEASGYDNDNLYATHSVDEVVAAYITQSQTYWPGFRDLMNYFLREKKDYILEGHILHPQFLQEILDQGNQGALEIIFVYKRDPKVIQAHLQKNQTAHDWALERTKEPETFAKLSAVIGVYGQYLKNEAEKCDFPTVELDQHFEQKINEVMGLLAGSI